MRQALDRLYDGCGWAAAFFMIAIAMLILLSIVTRLTALYVPGLTEYAGYCMAAASFFALAHTFRHGGHIRVTLLVQRLPEGRRRWAEIYCHSLGAVLAGYLAWHSILYVLQSREFGELSEGPDVTPLWIPQSAMAIGSVVLTIALVDRLIGILLGRTLPEPAGEALRVD